MVYTRRFWLRLSGFRILVFRVLGFVCCWKRSTFAGIWAYKHQRIFMPDPPHANLALAAECSKPPLFPLLPAVGLVHVVERGPLTHAAMQSPCSWHHSLMGQCEPPCLWDWQGSQSFSNSSSAIHWSAIWSVASSQDTEANAMWLWIVSPTPRQVASATTFMIRLLQVKPWGSGETMSTDSGKGFSSGSRHLLFHASSQRFPDLTGPGHPIDSM
jgi:hypothetical protein